MKQKAKSHNERTFYLKNEQITAPEIRLLDDRGGQIGIVSRAEALERALSEEKDLVMITSHAQPPVVKLIDFRKFLYQEEKRRQEARKGVKKSTVKDVQISLFIAEADLERLRGKAEEFLHDGFQVRVKLVLRGREMGKRDMAFELINSFVGSLKDSAVSTPPKMQGKVLIAVVVRKK